MLDPNMKPMCDQMHGQMKLRRLPDPADPRDWTSKIFECPTTDVCQQFYSPTAGYRSQQEAANNVINKAGYPLCKNHPLHPLYMYIIEVLPNCVAKFVCPDCRASENVPMKLDESADIWRRKG
jgi:hypothetical protein